MYKKIAALVLAAALLCSCTARVSVQRIPAELPRAEAPSATPTPEPTPAFTEEQQRYGSAAFGIKHQAVDLRGVRTVLQKVRRDAVRVCGSVRVAEAARIRGDGDIEKVGLRFVRPADQRIDERENKLAAGGAVRLQTGVAGKKRLGGMVVDGQLNAVTVGLGVLRQQARDFP